MAHISRPKNQHQNSHNHHPQLPTRGNRPGHTIPIPGVTKSVPGYPGFGPPLPGPDLEGVRNRSPDQADKYYPEWTSKNLDRNQYAESERLAAERLLEETLDLLKETKIRTKQDQNDVGERFKQRVGDISFWKSELDSKLAELKEHLDELDSQHIRVRMGLKACDEPLDISQKCLAHRNQRQGIDRYIKCFY